MKNILITRQKNRSQPLIQIFESEGFKTFIEPLFSVKKNNILKKNFQKNSAIIITSSNACEAIFGLNFSKQTKIFVVGKKTKQKLSEFGFENIAVAAENSALSLQDLIIKTHNKDNSLIYFHGSKITLDFKKNLKNLGFKVKKILAYQTFENENFSDDFLEISQKKIFDYVLIFSQNSAKIFMRLVKKNNLVEYFKHSQILCLSPKILEQIQKFGFKNSLIFDQFPILKKFYD
jgi:uroporphyrinogen-III synthase